MDWSATLTVIATGCGALIGVGAILAKVWKMASRIANIFESSIRVEEGLREVKATLDAHLSDHERERKVENDGESGQGIQRRERNRSRGHGYDYRLASE